MSETLKRPPAGRWSRNAIACLTSLLIVALAFQAARAAAPVPDFTLRLLDGKTASLQDYRGKPVLINFWHSK